jgi:4a-hydroxytetrahydrobiopterin dehydratase
MSNWDKIDNRLRKDFQFNSYLDGINFVNQIAKLAEKLNHHPEITIGYKKVTVVSTTHSVGNTITDQDIELGTQIDTIYNQNKL